MRTSLPGRLLAACALGLWLFAPRALGAQEDPRARLVAQGVAEALADTVARVAVEASARGLPARPLVDKAIEGAAKRVPAVRILAAVRVLVVRLDQARDSLRASGFASADGGLIAASAEAFAQGMSRADVAAIIRAAPSSEAAVAAISVAAALVVEGLDRASAARVVTESLRAGASAAQVLDLPATVRARGAAGVGPAAIPPGIGNLLPPGQKRRP